MKLLHDWTRRVVLACAVLALILVQPVNAVQVRVTEPGINATLGLMVTAGALNFYGTDVSGVDVLSVKVGQANIDLKPGNQAVLSLSVRAYVETVLGLAWSMEATFDVDAAVEVAAAPVDISDPDQGYRFVFRVLDVDISNWVTQRSSFGTTIPDFVFGQLEDFETWIADFIEPWSITGGVGLMKRLDNDWIDPLPVTRTDEHGVALEFRTLPVFSPAGLYPLSDLLAHRIGDLDGNTCVDRTDLMLLLGAIRARSDALSRYDLNADGAINVLDARMLTLHFNNSRGLPCW